MAAGSPISWSAWIAGCRGQAPAPLRAGATRGLDLTKCPFPALDRGFAQSGRLSCRRGAAHRPSGRALEACRARSRSGLRTPISLSRWSMRGGASWRAVRSAPDERKASGIVSGDGVAHRYVEEHGMRERRRRNDRAAHANGPRKACRRRTGSRWSRFCIIGPDRIYNTLTDLFLSSGEPGFGELHGLRNGLQGSGRPAGRPAGRALYRRLARRILARPRRALPPQVRLARSEHGLQSGLLLLPGLRGARGKTTSWAWISTRRSSRSSRRIATRSKASR